MVWLSHAGGKHHVIASSTSLLVACRGMMELFTNSQSWKGAPEWSVGSAYESMIRITRVRLMSKLMIPGSLFGERKHGRKYLH